MGQAKQNKPSASWVWVFLGNRRGQPSRSEHSVMSRKALLMSSSAFGQNIAGGSCKTLQLHILSLTQPPGLV